MSREYDEYLTKHIQAVKACFGLFPSWKESRHELTEHDISKYSEEEYRAYDDYFYPNEYSYGFVKDRFQYAWLHHQNTNKHHWQYWVLIYGGKIEGKHANHYQCLHPIYLSTVGGKLNYIRHNCVCYVKRRKINYDR